MYDSAWKRARVSAATAHAEAPDEPVSWGFANLRVRDLEHSYGRHFRAARVPLGRRNGGITSHYSAPEIAKLLEAANSGLRERLPQ